ncbi:hypothetical protein J3458_020040 [Metarhizium acridum]|uniref:uncharacterized protein n=1 Tax=Metarhizium acridum TaxID=92637 RepID=UPI001C6A975D|nr:hypothetical protein J3458_020040 [Metarhizium acridum]
MGPGTTADRLGPLTRSPSVGDERGPLALVVNLCRDDAFKSSRHALLPMNNSTALNPRDLQHLERRGCFSLPSRGMQDALLRAYFHHVHPFAPVVDVPDFAYRYTTGQVSILLLWSMFAAAGGVSHVYMRELRPASSTSMELTNVWWFVDEQLPTGELGTTRTEAKSTAFERAKAVYELEYEKETMLLIQSTYLMSYRLGRLNDVRGPWYWMGVAINLAYTAGLHRLPPPESPKAPAVEVPREVYHRFLP